MADIQRYLSLVTSEYADKPNFIAWLTAVLGPADDTASAGGSFAGAFDLDSAVGVQLDILGLIVGVSRTVDFQPSNGVSPVLDDDTFRVVLQARIAANAWDGTQPGLYNLWSTIFPGISLQYVDNQDMTATATVTGLSSSIEQDLIVHGYIVPKPMGVAVTYQFQAAITTALTFPMSFPVVFGPGIYATSTMRPTATVT